MSKRFSGVKARGREHTGKHNWSTDEMETTQSKNRAIVLIEEIKTNIKNNTSAKYTTRQHTGAKSAQKRQLQRANTGGK